MQNMYQDEVNGEYQMPQLQQHDGSTGQLSGSRTIARPRLEPGRPGSKDQPELGRKTVANGQHTKMTYSQQ